MIHSTVVASDVSNNKNKNLYAKKATSSMHLGREQENTVDFCLSALQHRLDWKHFSLLYKDDR